MFSDVNALRQSKGRVPLTINNALTAAAQEQADYISHTGNYAHVHGGSSPTSRAMAAGYQTTEWCCSENTHRTQIGLSAWTFWNLSTPHYYNMLNPKWTEIGLATSHVGVWTGWVLVFGSGIQSPTPTPSITQPITPPTTQPITQNVALSTGGAYRVAWGDTLGIIASRHGVSVTDLKAANGLYSDLIYTGQTLIIPTGAAGGTTTTSHATSPGIITQISSPASGAVMRPGFPIIGTASFDMSQSLYYKVEINGGQFGDTWVTVGYIHTTSISNGQLEYLNAVEPGSYTLKLVVIDAAANTVSSTSASFTVSE
jgi:LysM repeat protein